MRETFSVEQTSPPHHAAFKAEYQPLTVELTAELNCCEYDRLN